MSTINSIGLSLPKYKTSSEDIVNWAGKYYYHQGDVRKFRFLVGRSGIDSRYSVVPDFLPGCTPELFGNTSPSAKPGTAERLRVFDGKVLEMAVQSSSSALQNAGLMGEDITHLIAVSCTGMRAPGLEIMLSQSLALPPNTERFAINFMGCYAAFHAIKLGHYICSSTPKANVLICCAEACTIHFRNSSEDDDILSTAIFGDGSAAVVMSGKRMETDCGFEMLARHSALISAPESMSWDIQNDGFKMKLSKEVPQYIQSHIKTVYHELLQNAQLEKVDYYAVHPGGKNILEAFQKALELSVEDLQESYRVLKNYGNMSSPTVLFVLDKVRRNFLKSGKRTAVVFAAAFGPGLTVETALFQIENNQL